MRKLFAPILLAGTLALGACATSPYGGMGGPLETVLGSVLGGSVGGYGNGSYGGYGNGGYGGYGGYGSGNFQQAAINACGSQASRYGQVQIRDVRQQSSSTLRVYGNVYNRYGRSDDFACSFRSDGRITDFDL